MHAYQLEHVKKGCLARPDGLDIALDGSRIEGSHKGWNSIQRAQPSGIEMYTALGHDHFHRRNIRIGTSRLENKNSGISLPEFVASLHGSHHVYLTDYIARLFNKLSQKNLPNTKLLPTLPEVEDSEVFGLTQSKHSKTFCGLLPETDEDYKQVVSEPYDLLLG